MSRRNDRVIRVDTQSLRACADRLTAVNQQTEKLKIALEAVCAASGTTQLHQSLRPEILAVGQADVERCVQYLRDTAGDFEALERELAAKL